MFVSVVVLQGKGLEMLEYGLFPEYESLLSKNSQDLVVLEDEILRLNHLKSGLDPYIQKVFQWVSLNF